MPTFSILTITYNAERYLAETLQSVAAQSYPHYEHILWDGDSCDNTLAIARSFPHVTLHTGRDRGIADAMNRAAAYAQGTWLLHLHADDWLLHPGVLEMVATLIRHHPHLDWCYGRAHLVNAEGQLLSVTPYERYSASRLKKYNFLTHPATYIRRSCFEQLGGFRTELRYAMDYDLWLRASQTKTPYALSTPLAAFRQHAASLSTASPLATCDEAYHVRKRYTKGLYEKYRSYTTWKKRRRNLVKK